MGVTFEQLVFQRFEEYQAKQKQVKDLIKQMEEEIGDICVEYFKEMIRISVTEAIQGSVDFSFEVYAAIPPVIVSGRHEGHEYAFSLTTLDNEEIGWNISSKNNEGVPSNREYPLEDLSKELLKIMGRYEAMSEAESEQSADGEADSDVDLTTEKEEQINAPSRNSAQGR
jgi:hypothetical protein